MRGASLCMVGVIRWRWPWRFTVIQRIELVRAEGSAESVGT